MQPSDKQKFASLLSSALAFYDKDMSKFALYVWWQACEPFSYEQVAMAFTKHAIDPEHGKFAPKPADIVRQLAGTATDRAMIAWGKVFEAMGSVGAYSDVAFDDPVIHAVVDDLGGWPKVCRTETKELSYLQHRFTESYRAYAGRGQFDYPRALMGDRASDALFARRGLAAPKPALVGDSALALKVIAGGQAGGKTSIAFHALKAIENGPLMIGDRQREAA